MTGNWTVKLALLLATPPEHLNPPAINKVPQRAGNCRTDDGDLRRISPVSFARTHDD